MTKRYIPTGVTDLTPEETAKYSELIDQVTTILNKKNYQLIQTPTLESFDFLANGMGPTLQQKSVKFVDTTGQVVTLRPDNTLAVARLVSTRLKHHTNPLKLYYKAPVFRITDPHSNQNMERFQIGLEYIGEKSPKIDAEVIKQCIDCIKATGIKSFGVDIGHVDFAKGFSSDKKEALLNGDYVKLGYIPERGGTELIQDHQELSRCMKHLIDDGYGEYITVNKGLVKDLHYYTGIIFDVYVGLTKKSVASGGRYDNLLGLFGEDRPAVGFAYNVDKLIDELNEQEELAC